MKIQTRQQLIRPTGPTPSGGPTEPSGPPPEDHYTPQHSTSHGGRGLAALAVTGGASALGAVGGGYAARGLAQLAGGEGAQTAIAAVVGGAGGAFAGFVVGATVSFFCFSNYNMQG